MRGSPYLGVMLRKGFANSAMTFGSVFRMVLSLFVLALVIGLAGERGFFIVSAHEVSQRAEIVATTGAPTNHLDRIDDRRAACSQSICSSTAAVESPEWIPWRFDRELFALLESHITAGFTREPDPYPPRIPLT